LQLNDIEHRLTRVRRPHTNGFVERFNRTVLDEFFRTAFRTTLYESVEALQADLDAWLLSYNTEQPHHGYRNLGRRSIDTINYYIENRRTQPAAWRLWRSPWRWQAVLQFPQQPQVRPI